MIMTSRRVEEVDRPESEGVVKKVERGDLASPIVCVLKGDETFVSVEISRCPLTTFF